MKTIDLNCDLGEGVGNEVKLMPHISSCSIACGGHYGNKKTIRETIFKANDFDLSIGVHPSYCDIKNFGRKSVQIPLQTLQDDLRRQFDLFFSFQTPTHFKPHGALNNDVCHDEEKAKAIVSVFSEYAEGISVFCQPKSELAKAAGKNGFKVVYEGFGDRAYNPDGTLVSRNKKGAVLTDKKLISSQVVSLVNQHNLIAINGDIVSLSVQTICLHSDTPNIANNISYLKKQLNQYSIRVQAN